MFKILESPMQIPHPIALVLSYPALDFNFTSWMTPTNLAVLQSEASSAFIPGLGQQKDHLSHRSPLSVVDDVHSKRMRRKKSWKRSLSAPFSGAPPSHTPPTSLSGTPASGQSTPRSCSLMSSLPTTPEETRKTRGHKSKSVTFRPNGYSGRDGDTDDDLVETDGGEDADYYPLQEEEKPILARVMTSEAELYLMSDGVANPVHTESDITDESTPVRKTASIPFGTRLTMTSRTGFFQDRIISPSMVCHIIKPEI